MVTARPVAFGHRDLDADLAEIIGPWAEGKARPAHGSAEAALLPRLVASRRASVAVVTALSFALVAGTAFILRDRTPAEPEVVAREEPPVPTAVAERDRPVPATVTAAEEAAPEAAAMAAPAAAPAPVAAAGRAAPEKARVRPDSPVRPDRSARVAAAPPAPEPTAAATPDAPVQLAMVPPAPAPARAAAAAPPVAAEPTAREVEVATEARRARKDGIDSMRSLRRQ